jgi:hypothetical protein
LVFSFWLKSINNLQIEFNAKSSAPGITQKQSVGGTGFPAGAEIMAGSARPTGLTYLNIQPRTQNPEPKTLNPLSRTRLK